MEAIWELIWELIVAIEGDGDGTDGTEPRGPPARSGWPGP